MSEKIIQLEAVNPIDLYGINDNKLEMLKNTFPKLKVIARGDTIKVVGDDLEIEQFEEKLNRMVEYFHKYGNISENNIERILETSAAETAKTSE
ncbi:MAG: phosphate starvation-inducible protein PhoH, partial [Bacteroidetes bacterium]|nr:phosphate starvation-inducible protein PhoH [Bacteroidota bacterium]